MNNDTENCCGKSPHPGIGMKEVFQARDAKHYQFRGYQFGKLLLTWVWQGSGAPFMDKCTTHMRDGELEKTFHGKAILLTPWRRNQYWESLPQRALVIAWRYR